MQKNKMMTAGLVILCGGMMTACSLAPAYERPQTPSPAAWHAADAGSARVIARDWWRSFGSAELNALMDDALRDNLDLRAGIQRVEQARAGLQIAQSSLLPSASASGGATRTRNNPAEGRSNSTTSVRGGLDISYELDLFGGNRAGADAAAARYAGSRYDHDALALVVMADVARGYFSLLNLRERLAVADSNLANARELQRIVGARVRAGAESDIELARQTSSVASSEAACASLVQQMAAAENALAVLLGRAPQTVTVAVRDLDDVVVPAIEAGQPADLLERRPDLRAAEAGLIAANADIGAARAAFYPSLNIGAGASVAAAGFGDPASTALSILSSLSAPIFQGGRLEGGLTQATARQAELAENYRKAVLVSFQEAEDALAAVRAAQQRENALRTAMQESRKAYRLSKTRYDAGAIDFQTLLDTQNAQRSAEDSFAQARLARLLAAVDLFKALGGGWESAPRVTAGAAGRS